MYSGNFRIMPDTKRFMLKECRYIPRLDTDRLVLRQLLPDDAEDLRKWLGRDEVYTYWGRPASKGEKNPELLFVDPRPSVKRKPSNDFLWGIELKETQRVIGMIEVFDVENNRFGMVGFRIDPQLWNEGICTEAMKRVIDFIFSETEMDRLQGNANVKNTGSNRVLEKSGFQLEGTIRHDKMVSEYCDYNIWGIIKDDIRK